MKTQDYIPFGEEWEKGMMKWKKELLIELLRNKLMAVQSMVVENELLKEKLIKTQNLAK